jgi:hypothetical protein
LILLSEERDFCIISPRKFFGKEFGEKEVAGLNEKNEVPLSHDVFESPAETKVRAPFCGEVASHNQEPL